MKSFLEKESLKILVITSVFPNEKQPTLGTFVRERMLHVAKYCDVTVVAPAPWFPLIRFFKKDYRPLVPKIEIQDGLQVYHPKFFNLPGLIKCLDGIFFFFSSILTLYKIKKSFDFDIIDAHFAYPDGLGAVLLGRLFKKPVAITLRGTIVPLSKYRLRRFQISFALKRADIVFSVCKALKDKAVSLGVQEEKIVVVSNGVDTNKFQPINQRDVRELLNLPLDKKIIISIGAIVKRKGFHKIIKALPFIIKRQPDILLVIVGGASVEGNFKSELDLLVERLSLQKYVLFAGNVPHRDIYKWINASDIFCLATSNEGWANVLLEALACGKPVVTTTVGGNGEVINSSNYGILVSPEEENGLENALLGAFEKEWNDKELIEYACQNSWDRAANLILGNYIKIKNSL
jgi:teichuronic acid biosynthesis glycosyltransferase TuaC